MPIAVLIFVSAAAALTVYKIFPLNKLLSDGVSDMTQLQSVLAEWMQWSRVRFALWCAQWAALMWWFMQWAGRGRYPWTR